MSELPGKSHGQRSLAGYTVHRVTKSQTQLDQRTIHTHENLERQTDWIYPVLKFVYLYQESKVNILTEIFIKMTKTKV